MASAASSSVERLAMVVVRAGEMLCALPLAGVIETLRCPPLLVVSGAPECVAGIAIIRGATVAVVDLGRLLGAQAAAVTGGRLVTLRASSRVVGLAVQSVIGVREFDGATLAEVPPLLRQAHPNVLIALGSLDRELLLVLDGARVLTDEMMSRLEA